jgi:chromosome segregation ATPase
MRFRFAASSCFVVAVVLGRSAWASPDFEKEARDYATANHLPIREVPLNVPGREGVKRIFVPVTDATHADFVKRFTQKGGIIRQQASDQEHVQFAVSPDATIGNWAQAGGAPFAVTSGGRYIALEMTPAEKEFFKTNAPATQKGTNGTGRNSGCMTWLANGNVAPDQALSHKIGVKRSTAPSNLVKKFVHAGNDSIIVGVPVLTDQNGTQQARQQIAAYENAIRNAEAQIERYGQQGGNRVKTFQQQIAPINDGIAKIDAALDARKNQPAVIVGLKVRREEYNKALDAATGQHEAPYVARVKQLDDAINAGKQQVAQLETNRGNALKPFTDAVATREREYATLMGTIPEGRAGRANPQYTARMAQLDQTIAQAEATIKQYSPHPQYRAQVAQWQTSLAQNKQAKDQLSKIDPATYNPQYEARVGQLDASINQLETSIKQTQDAAGQLKTQIEQARQQKDQFVKAGPGANTNNAQYDARVAQIDQAIGNLDNSLKQYGAMPQYATHVANWKLQITQNQQEKERLTKAGPAAYNPQYDARIAQLDQTITNLNNSIKQYGAHPQYRAQLPAWQQQVAQTQQEKDRLTKGGPAAYNPQYDARVTQFDQTITNLENQVKQNEARVGQLQQQLAAPRDEKAQLVKLGPASYNPQYEQALKGIDQQIANLETTIKTHGATPQYKASLPQWQQQLAQQKQSKEKLTKVGPSNYNPQYEARVAQLDQTITNLDNSIKANEANPQQQASVAQWKQQRDQQIELKGVLAKMGAAGYDAQLDGRITQAQQQVVGAKAQLANQTEALGTQLDAAKNAIAQNEGIKGELSRHGATKYNPAYEQQFVNLSNSISNLETNIKNPAYNAAQVAQWKTQLADQQKAKERLVAAGPEAYNPYEPQIQQLRAQIDQNKGLIAPLKVQVELADASANGEKLLAAKFSALSDADLMGPPPGAGAAEAVEAAKK